MKEDGEREMYERGWRRVKVEKRGREMEERECVRKGGRALEKKEWLTLIF